MSELTIQASPRDRGAPDVICRFGDEMVHRDHIHPSKQADRKRFTKAVCEAVPAVKPDEVDAKLISVAEELDKRSEAQNEPQIDLCEAAEIDVTRITRPELILRPEVSAIAIPRIVESSGNLIGQWFHYIRDSKGRRVEPMDPDCLRLTDGKLYFHPMPTEPTRLDVSELGRWSAKSRRRWLEGEPAPTTADVLKAVSDRIDRYVCLPEASVQGHGITLALWVMLTYAFRAVPAVPYLYLAGPLGSGKSRTMEVIKSMVWRPMMASSLTGPTLFRSKHTTGGTLLLDEAERMRDESPDMAELRSMLLAGYRLGGQARRLEPVGDTFRAVSFDAYGPTVLACIKGLPPALASRCVTVKMMRAPKGDPSVKRSLDDSPAEAVRVLDALHRWAIEYAYLAVTTELGEVGLANRDFELWSPLLRIAQHTGDAEISEFMVKHAQAMADASSEDQSPDADRVFILALYQLRSLGGMPEPAEVLEQARIVEPGWFDSWSARGLSNTLRHYGIETAKTNGRRRYRTDLQQIERVAERYGFDLGGGDDE